MSLCMSVSVLPQLSLAISYCLSGRQCAHVLPVCITLPQAGNGVSCDHRPQVPSTEVKCVAHHRLLLASLSFLVIKRGRT